MSTTPVGSVNEVACELLDRWLQHWRQEAQQPPPGSAREEPAAAVAPPTQEAGTSPLPASPAAAAHLPRPRSGHDDGLAVLQAFAACLDPQAGGAVGDPGSTRP